jgi:hypothetical protein
MLAVLTSTATLARNGNPDPAVVKALADVRQAGHGVAIVSNHDRPAWFDPTFANTGVEFLKEQSRQNGDIINRVTQHLNLAHHDVLVLASKLEDLYMGKNGRAVVIAADWSPDAKVRSLGISARTPEEFVEIVRLTAQWPGAWWHAANGSRYSVRALCDLSSYGATATQQDFSDRVTHTVKQGGANLMALLAVGSRSLLKAGVDGIKALALGTYPSSSSANNDTEILSDFTHRLRTTASRCQLAKRGEPLFVRHRPSIKRSSGGAINRTDPADQVESVHLNPVYKRSLGGRHVIVIDDVTTYGVSFGVAAAFLAKAGAKSMQGVALGKFGNQLRYYEIDLTGDPFAPITVGQYKVLGTNTFAGTNDPSAQNTLRTIIP